MSSGPTTIPPFTGTIPVLTPVPGSPPKRGPMGGVSARRLSFVGSSPDPLRLRIQKSLAIAIESITAGVDGAKNTLQGRVFRGRMTFDQDSASPDTVPMVSILESEPQTGDRMDSNDGDGTKTLCDYRLIIQGWAEDDLQNPTDPAHYLRADVERAIAKQCLRESGHILSISHVKRLEFIGSAVQAPALPSEKCFFLLEIRLLIAEDHLQPYT